MGEPISMPFVEAKIVLLGDTGVGKTSIVLRYVEQRFSNTSTPTIGASFLTKTIWVNENRIKLQLWDTAGQERFRSLAPMYYRGAAAALLVYDVTDEESFGQVKDWVKELRHNATEDVNIAIVGNQVDKPYRKISAETASEYGQSIGAKTFETSAKKNTGIDEMFVEVARVILESRAHMPPKPEGLKENNNQSECN